MKRYERYAGVIAACMLCMLVLLVAELVRVQLKAEEIHTQEEDMKNTVWDEIKRLRDEKIADYVALSVEEVEKEYQIEPRVITQQCLQKLRIRVSDADREILYRIVQAEAGGEDALGKKMVADVIVNRVNHRKFPNTVQGVVFQNSGGKVQFAPTADGRYQAVTVTKETKQAVDEALLEEDYTSGALYFVASAKTTADKASWFQTHLTCRGTHGGHTFYQ